MTDVGCRRSVRGKSDVGDRLRGRDQTSEISGQEERRRRSAVGKADVRCPMSGLEVGDPR